jgi:hypothetical protein
MSANIVSVQNKLTVSFLSPVKAQFLLFSLLSELLLLHLWKNTSN